MSQQVPSTKPNRRNFLQTAAAATAGFSLFTIAGTKSSGKILGANETIRVGVAGINGRGGSHISEFAGMKDVDIIYLIDPDSSLWESRARTAEERGGVRPKAVADIRRALDDKTLDAVSVATCNHWHALITIWACQAKKDVYVEKPISHNVFEGRKCVEAARKYERVVQHGTQSRSDGNLARQIAAIHSGKYGKLLVSKGYCCKPRWSIGFKPLAMAPAHLDFDIWTGPAQKMDYHPNLHPYNWHWFWETGNGDAGNQGVHQMDIARWAIKDATLPKSVWSVGGRYAPGEEDYEDQAETPNMLLSVFDYGDTQLVFETRGLVGKAGAPAAQVTNEFYMEDGVIRDGKFYPYKNKDGAEPVAGEEASVVPGGAFGSFIDSVRKRRIEDNNAPAETAHYSAALCHLGNISYRLGKQAAFDQKPDLGEQTVVKDGFNTLVENLRGVGINLGETAYMAGPALAFDAEKEKFIMNEDANALLTRPERQPFVVPTMI